MHDRAAVSVQAVNVLVGEPSARLLMQLAECTGGRERDDGRAAALEARGGAAHPCLPLV